MDSELFTVGGVGLGSGKMGSVQDITRHNVTQQDVWFSQVKLMRSWRWVGNALFYLLVVYTIVAFFVQALPEGIAWWKYSTTKSSFSQKEGLQYLGASTNVVRDDTGWPSTLSPDEKLMVAQNNAITNLATAPMAAAPSMGAPVKSSFTMPQKAVHKKLETPEDKLLAKQAGHM